MAAECELNFVALDSFGEMLTEIRLENDGDMFGSILVGGLEHVFFPCIGNKWE